MLRGNDRVSWPTGPELPAGAWRGGGCNGSGPRPRENNDRLPCRILRRGPFLRAARAPCVLTTLTDEHTMHNECYGYPRVVVNIVPDGYSNTRARAPPCSAAPEPCAARSGKLRGKSRRCTPPFRDGARPFHDSHRARSRAAPQNRPAGRICQCLSIGRCAFSWVWRALDASRGARGVARFPLLLSLMNRCSGDGYASEPRCPRIGAFNCVARWRLQYRGLEGARRNRWRSRNASGRYNIAAISVGSVEGAGLVTATVRWYTYPYR